MLNLKAPISEIFVSNQGEGIFVGEPQVFIRFSGCNLRCDYCDTAKDQTLSENQTYFSILKIIEICKKSKAQGCSTVSLTGGEPLLYFDFLKVLLPQIKKLKMKVYLETNGTLPQEYKAVQKLVDVVAMDMKMPTACREILWKAHQEFLKFAKDKAFVKIILTDKTAKEEVTKAAQIIKSISKNIPLILQPVTALGKIKDPKPSALFEFGQAARKHLRFVAITPQMHKIWEIK